MEVARKNRRKKSNSKKSNSKKEAASRKTKRKVEGTKRQMERHLICRHMRLAFEESATWLVEILERQREEVAAQAAYALALGKEAGLR